MRCCSALTDPYDSDPGSITNDAVWGKILDFAELSHRHETWLVVFVLLGEDLRMQSSHRRVNLPKIASPPTAFGAGPPTDHVGLVPLQGLCTCHSFSWGHPPPRVLQSHCLEIIFNMKSSKKPSLQIPVIWPPNLQFFIPTVFPNFLYGIYSQLEVDCLCIGL